MIQSVKHVEKFSLPTRGIEWFGEPSTDTDTFSLGFLSVVTRTTDATRVWHLSSKHGNHLIPVDREALGRTRRAPRRWRDEGLRRPRLQALMNTSLELMFAHAVVRRRVNMLCGKSAAAPNAANTLLSRSVTPNWIWRHCQVQSQCGGAEPHLLQRKAAKSGLGWPSGDWWKTRMVVLLWKTNKHIDDNCDTGPSTDVSHCRSNGSRKTSQL